MIKCDLTQSFLSIHEEKWQPIVADILTQLQNGKEPYTGWVQYADTLSEEEITEILNIAQEIKENCTAFVVIGIGGSYLGAKAAIEMLKPLGGIKNPAIYFAGYQLSGRYYTELFQILEKEEVTVCFISKSGTTIEPMTVFTLFKDFLQKKYGDTAREHIYAITDHDKGSLRAEAEREQYKTMVIPANIGGRYSVISSAGLLPLAVAGIDIRQILEGVKDAMHKYLALDLKENEAAQYGVMRHLLEEQGKIMEIFEIYDQELLYMAEWLKQLFGESGCKNGKGIFPTSLRMSTDLHSLGQFLQDGRQNFFETVLSFDKPTYDIETQNDPVHSMHKLNKIIQKSARAAHRANQTPGITITLAECSPYVFGQLVYFFEIACAVSCYLDDVNPFDQPGVEHYKKHIKEMLNERR